MTTTLNIIVCLMLIAGCRLATAAVGKFWHYTDPHADFSYLDEGYSCQNEAHQRSQIGDYLCDPPYSLLQSSIDAMNTIEPNVDHIIWTGDNVLHSIQADEKDIFTQDLKSEINENITTMFKNAFVDVPVYPSLGNHEHFPKDQFPPSPDAMYARLKESWEDWVTDQAFSATFTKGGYYAINLSQYVKLISLNTNLNYIKNKAVKYVTDPADQFKWFQDQLNDARRTGRKVHLIAHIGFGFPKGTASTQMYDNYHMRYLDLMDRYHDVIAAMFFGHEHVDVFKVYHDSKGIARFPMLFAPAVSPIVRKSVPRNPAVRLISYEKETGRILEIMQYFLDLRKAIKTGVVQWDLLYTFTTTYGTSDVSAESAAAVWQKLKNESLMKMFLRLSVGNATQLDCDQKCMDMYWCGIGHLDHSGFADCMKSWHMTVPSGVDRAVGIKTLIWLLSMAITCLSLLHLKDSMF